MMEIYCMEQTMKSSTTNKRIVVRLTKDNILEYDINTEIFDDPFLEAATRAVESIKGQKHKMVRGVTECWETKASGSKPTVILRAPRNPELYNSYWILINAGCYAKAEQLREKFMMQNDVDLSKEPIHASNSGNK